MLGNRRREKEGRRRGRMKRSQVKKDSTNHSRYSLIYSFIQPVTCSNGNKRKEQPSHAKESLARKETVKGPSREREREREREACTSRAVEAIDP